MSDEIELREGHTRYCKTHKVSFSEACPGCTVDDSFERDPERALLRIKNTSESIRNRTLQQLVGTNGKAGTIHAN